VNWVFLYNAAGVIAILIVAYFLYEVLHETDPVLDEPLSSPEIPQLSPQEVRERLLQNEDIILIDVRNPSEWENTSHVDGAILLSLRDFGTRALAVLPDKDAPIIVMCDWGNIRSMKAAEWLMARGYTNVSNLDGGMNAWTAASLPLFEHPAQ
jgi:rhodanese-related sulfurtransferase